MNYEPLKIKKRGDDGHKVISVRIGIDLLERIDEIAKTSNRSRNEIINLILQHGTENIVYEPNEVVL
ncbi:MAG: CopG family transcriptional regulator [Oscillospiraceae bacterium]|nr:CopG family transcriptional regulator [Oscillospiraceae bacterium]